MNRTAVVAREATSVSWRGEMVAAAIRQGPSFMTLLLILCGAWQFGNYVIQVGVPAHLEQIKAGYREIQKVHDANLERLIATFEREQNRLHGVLNALENLIENKQLLKENHQLLLQILRELKHVLGARGAGVAEDRQEAASRAASASGRSLSGNAGPVPASQ